MTGRVRRARDRRGWTLADLAAALGVTEIEAASIERNPTDRHRVKLANAFGPAWHERPRKDME